MTLEAVLDRHSAVFREELGHIPIKLRLSLNPDARPVNPRARPEPPALRTPVDADAVTEPAEAGVAGTPVSAGMLAGARRLSGTVGVSTPAVAVGAEMSLGVGTPAEAAGAERPLGAGVLAEAAGAGALREPEAALVTCGKCPQHG